MKKHITILSIAVLVLILVGVSVITYAEQAVKQTSDRQIAPSQILRLHRVPVAKPSDAVRTPKKPCKKLPGTNLVDWMDVTDSGRFLVYNINDHGNPYKRSIYRYNIDTDQRIYIGKGGFARISNDGSAVLYVSGATPMGYKFKVWRSTGETIDLPVHHSSLALNYDIAGSEAQGKMIAYVDALSHKPRILRLDTNQIVGVNVAGVSERLNIWDMLFSGGGSNRLVFSNMDFNNSANRGIFTSTPLRNLSAVNEIDTNKVIGAIAQAGIDASRNNLVYVQRGQVEGSLRSVVHFYNMKAGTGGSIGIQANKYGFLTHRPAISRNYVAYISRIRWEGSEPPSVVVTDIDSSRTFDLSSLFDQSIGTITEVDVSADGRRVILQANDLVIDKLYMEQPSEFLNKWNIHVCELPDWNR